MQKQREAEEFALARKLRALGVFFDKDEFERRQVHTAGLSITQNAGVPSEAFDLPSGMAAYAFNVLIANDSRHKVLSPIYVAFEGPAWEFHMTLVPDPERKKPPHRRSYYVLHPRRARYERETVLNHLIGRRRLLAPSQVVEGFLLAVGQDPIPSGYRDFDRFTVALTLFDQTGHSHDSLFGMVVRRGPKREPTLDTYAAVQQSRRLILQD
jgi:hypothetical protein